MAKTFYEFMLKYKDKDTASGDLIRDMMHELRIHPEEEVDKIDSEEMFMHYLRNHYACRECIATAKRCWQSYRKYLEKAA